MNTLKLIFSIPLFLFFLNKIVFAQTTFDINEIMPNVKDLRGGSSFWIVDGLKKERRKSCDLYENNYTFYSKQRQEKMGIMRNNTYMFSVRVFSCNNFISALELYNELSKVEGKIKEKNMVAPVPFGDRGKMIVMNTDNASMGADFYTTYLLKSFVVQVYSNDGFAEMDIAGMVEENLLKYIKKQPASYFVNKVNLIADYDGKVYKTDVGFSNDNISILDIEGTVFDADNRPVAGVKIGAEETGQSATTDEKGNYRLKVFEYAGKELKLKKMIFLPFAIDKSKLAIASGVYKINVKSSRTFSKPVLNIFMNKNNLFGRMYDLTSAKNYIVSGSLSGSSVKFNATCADLGETCSYSFLGESSGGQISGRIFGMGEVGSFSITKNLMELDNQTKTIKELGAALLEASLNKDNISVKEASEFSFSRGTDKKFIEINFGENLSNLIYVDKLSVNLLVTKAKLQGDAELYLYSLKNKGGKLTPERVKKLASVSAKSVNENLNFDMTLEYLNIHDRKFLIGFESANNFEITLKPSKDFANVSLYQERELIPEINIKGSVETFEGRGLSSNVGKVGGKNAPDIELSVSIDAADGLLLDFIDIKSVGEVVRRWNTNNLDIYPLAVISKSDKVLNEADGSIRYKIDSNRAKFTVSLYKGSLNKSDISSFTISLRIGGRVYVGKIDVD